MTNEEILNRVYVFIETLEDDHEDVKFYLKTGGRAVYFYLRGLMGEDD